MRRVLRQKAESEVKNIFNNQSRSRKDTNEIPVLVLTGGIKKGFLKLLLSVPALF
jgi:hypothetical protein